MFKLKKSVVDVAIVCSDFARSVEFYRDKLGLEIVFDFQIPKEIAVSAGLAPRQFRQVRFRAGETLIKLMEIEDPPPALSESFRTGVRWLTFIIENVPETYAALQAKGVEFASEPVVPEDAAFIVCAKAPDGIMVEFVQPYPE